MRAAASSAFFFFRRLSTFMASPSSTACAAHHIWAAVHYSGLPRLLKHAHCQALATRHYGTSKPTMTWACNAVQALSCRQHLLKQAARALLVAFLGFQLGLRRFLRLFTQ